MDAPQGEGWETLPLFLPFLNLFFHFFSNALSQSCKNHLPIWSMACGCGGQSLNLCVFACVCKHFRKVQICKSILFVCVHGRRLVYVDISVCTPKSAPPVGHRECVC